MLIKKFEYYSKVDEIDSEFDRCFNELTEEFSILLDKYENKYPNVMEYKDEVVNQLEKIIYNR